MGTIRRPRAASKAEAFAGWGIAHEIWVPPQVSLDAPTSLADGPGLWRGEGDLPALSAEKTKLLVYPVPDDWWPSVTHADLRDLRAVSWQIRGDAAALLDDVRRLTLAAAGVFDDSLKLRKDPTTNALDGLVAKVRTFATRWGPLWECTAHIVCLWSPVGVLSRPRGPCRWYPQEYPLAVVWYAHQVQAVVDLATALQTGAGIPEAQLQCLGVIKEAALPDSIRDKRGTLNKERGDTFRNISRHGLTGKIRRDAENWYGNQIGALNWQLEDRKPVDATAALISFITRVMRAPGGPCPSIGWNHDATQLCPVLQSGLGWIQAAWVEVMVRICGGDVRSQGAGWYQCDACDMLYERLGRRPQRRRRSYCPRCREGDKASKRLWASAMRKKRRGEERDAAPEE